MRILDKGSVARSYFSLSTLLGDYDKVWRNKIVANTVGHDVGSHVGRALVLSSAFLALEEIKRNLSMPNFAQ